VASSEEQRIHQKKEGAGEGKKTGERELFPLRMRSAGKEEPRILKKEEFGRKERTTIFLTSENQRKKSNWGS